MQLLLFSIVSQTSVRLIPPIFLRKRSRRPRLRDTSSIGMTRGLSILVPVSDKGNEGGPVLTFVVRGEYCTFSLARSLAASPSSARSFSFSFLGSLDPFFPLCLFPFPPPIPSPPIAHRLTAVSPRLASPRLTSLRSPPSLFFSVLPSLCLLESIRHRKARNRAGIYTSRCRTTRFW